MQSYAGKYIPAVAYKILNVNPSADLKINLKGVAIGVGLCDPINVCYVKFLCVPCQGQIIQMTWIKQVTFCGHMNRLDQAKYLNEHLDLL